jgi:uncharacterized protein
MILDTASIKDGHSVIQQTSVLEEVKMHLPPLVEPVSCTATIDRTGPALFIQLGFIAHFYQSCARCLENYQETVHGEFRLILQEREGSPGPAKEGDTADFYFDAENAEVDISPLIFDEIMTTLPLKPLCDENCKGIELAPSQQKVIEKEPDPRWEALKKLQQNRNQSV